MHGLKTIERLNRDAAEADRIVEKYAAPESALANANERDFLIGYHSDVAIITPLKTKAVQWAYTNIKEHLGREGIAYVVHRPQGEELEALVRANGFRVN